MCALRSHSFLTVTHPKFMTQIFFRTHFFFYSRTLLFAPVTSVWCVNRSFQAFVFRQLCWGRVSCCLLPNVHHVHCTSFRFNKFFPFIFLLPSFSLCSPHRCPYCFYVIYSCNRLHNPMNKKKITSIRNELLNWKKTHFFMSSLRNPQFKANFRDKRKLFSLYFIINLLNIKRDRRYNAFAFATLIGHICRSATTPNKLIANIRHEQEHGEWDTEKEGEREYEKDPKPSHADHFLLSKQLYLDFNFAKCYHVNTLL